MVINMASFIIKFSQRFSKLILNITALLMAMLALLVFYQVITRFIFDAPSTWSEILARLLMVWMVYLSIGCVFRQGSMIAINFFVDLLPDRVGIWFKRGVTLVVLVFTFILMYYGWEMAQRVSSQNVSMLNISAFWLYVSIPAGGLFSIPAILEWHLREIECCNETNTVDATKATEV